MKNKRKKILLKKKRKRFFAKGDYQELGYQE
jgi:hypothetical protein